MINFPTNNFQNLSLNDYPKFLLKIVLIIVAGSITSLFFVKTDEITELRGEVISGLGIQTLKSPIDGILRNSFVVDGEKVEKNQKLFEFDGKKLKSQITSYERELELHSNDLKNTQNDCILVDNLLQKKLKIAKKEYTLREGILLKFESLFNEGAVSQLDYLQRQSRYLEVQNNLYQTKTNIELQKTKCQKQTNELNLKISKVNNEKQIANTSLKELIVRSPGKGFVYDFSPLENGSSMIEGERLASYVPKSKLFVRATVSGKDIANLSTGKDVTMRFDSYDFTKYGTIEGSINKIAPQRRSSTSKDSFQTRDNNFSSSEYTILINLDKNYIELNDKKFPLLLGMDTSILIKLRQKRLIEYFTNAFKLFYDPMKNVKTD
ncbi:HlyD family secretion protein [Prochlorococcus sp. AH-716-N03]|nr:HlyD family secretion protein [Prochlorococcus sp. AH-716-N03]